jgi:ketosteroid isomerase-like protein
MSQENVEVVRRAYEAFNRWGVNPRGERNPDIPPLLHPEVEFHTYANVPEAGVYRGRDAVIEYHERVFGLFERVRVELEELLPAGDRAVIISRQHTVPRGGEAEIMQQVVEIWTIRDGLLAVRKPFSTRAEALETVGL